MSIKKITIVLLTLGVWLLPASHALGASAPAWKLTAVPLPTNFAPGSHGTTAIGPLFLPIATNVGAAPTTDPIVLEATLPNGIAPVDVFGLEGGDPESPNPTCSIVAPTVTCETTGPLHSNRWLGALIAVDVAPDAEGTLNADVKVSGGGAPEATATAPLQISDEAPSFGFISGPAGLTSALTNSDGAAATQAGSHPEQLTVNLGFPTEQAAGGIEGLIAAGHLHDQHTDLPRGLIVDPTSTPVLCTEAQLTVSDTLLPGCPAASQVGIVNALSVVGGVSISANPLYNMVPPPGVPAQLGFDAFGAGVYIHLQGDVRSDGDFGLSSIASDIIALPGSPVIGAQAQLWGDPSNASHDQIRGTKCLLNGGSCPVEPQKTAFLTMPSECASSTTFSAAIDSWEELGVFHERSVETTDLGGNPVGVEGCNALEFKPSIEPKPTTNLTDSPSGLDFTLHQPQNTNLEGLSTAALRDATVTLPEGMVVNPSSANGQAACSTDQIGLTTAVEASPINFSKDPDECPDAAKLGKLEVTTPLLGERDESGTKFLRDPEGNAIPRPLEGSVYLAAPFDNPFGSLLAIYLVIEDPQSGTIAKLAGQVKADPSTGQLTTTVRENPQLPLEDVLIHLFTGPGAPLITPLTCGTHTTNSDLTPWSSPEGVDANPSDSFQSTAAPGGGSCPASEAEAPNNPSFTAGTTSPQAGSFSPFVLKLSREDGTQRQSGLETTLPPGLSGKLAGLGSCPEAQIAQARARSNPNQGAIEQADPSCPASSEVGTVDVAAGAGITPVHASGHAYLAGPYKGAPLSMVIITPAIAGPFDLGAVTVRAALNVDPTTAQIHAVSDPLPTILQGIPLDLRSAVLRADRPQFTLNPTNCNPMAIEATTTSTLGQAKALSSPFQVGGCAPLPFKPKLSLKLKGGTKRGAHPKLIATLKAKPGEANIAKASVKLPRSAFLDQAHIGTVCTRVQFAASACPKASIYGKASATTPLLDYELSGNVYLRSSSNELPDLLIDLRGPDHQPIRIELAGRTDSVKGALRNTFDLVPDAPVSTFRLELFGGKRGLVINSRDLCARTYRATVQMDAQSGKVFDSSPVVKASCRKGRKQGR